MFPVALATFGNNLYVANAAGSDGNNYMGNVTEYNATTGAMGFTISSGIDEPDSLALSGSNLYVLNQQGGTPAGTGTVTEYDATTGASGFTINTDVAGMLDLASIGNNLYALNNTGSTVNTIIDYNATTGASILTVSSGLDDPRAIAVSPVPEPEPWEGVAGSLSLFWWLQHFRGNRKRGRTSVCRP